MAKKRTLAPFYTKQMQRVTRQALASRDLNLVMHTTNAVRYTRRVKALNHLMRHSWPRPRSGVNYAAIDSRLGILALMA